MNSSSDAAETMVKMTLQGTEMALKVTGSAAKNIGAILIAISKDKTKSRGKTTLNNMIKSGKELKVFTLSEKALKTFVKEAKKYGVLYNVLIDKKQSKKDGMVDIIVRAEDAAKINRIFERFFESATIKSEKSKEKEDITKENNEPLNPKKESEKSPQSDISSDCLREGYKKDEKPSVRKDLKELKKTIDKRGSYKSNDFKSKRIKKVKEK